MSVISVMSDAELLTLQELEFGKAVQGLCLAFM